MFSRLIPFSVIFSLILSGCATSPADLRQPDNLVLNTDVGLNYQHIHRKLSDCYNEDFSGSMITAQSGIHEQIYSDLGESELSHFMDGALGRVVYMTTDLKKLDQEMTKVKVYVYFSTWKKRAENIQSFLKTRPLDCQEL